MGPPQTTDEHVMFALKALAKADSKHMVTILIITDKRWETIGIFLYSVDYGPVYKLL